MKRFAFLFLAAALTALALLAPASASAKVPDEEDILRRTTDAQSPFYYPALLVRYNAGDTSLTDEDYYYLYYGFAYREDYKPLATNPDLDKMLMLLAALDPEQPNVESLEAIVSFGTEALKRDPFSPNILNTLSFAYGALGDREREEAYAARMNGVLRTILASGDGFTQKTPRHVLMFSHALDALAAEGLTPGKARIVSRTVEFVPLAVPYVVEGKKRKGFYFDFGRVYWNKPEGYTYQRDRTWQFNNLKPRTYK